MSSSVFEVGDAGQVLPSSPLSNSEFTLMFPLHSDCQQRASFFWWKCRLTPSHCLHQKMLLYWCSNRRSLTRWFNRSDSFMNITRLWVNGRENLVLAPDALTLPCSSHKCMCLTNVASFKRINVMFFNSVRNGSINTDFLNSVHRYLGEVNLKNLRGKDSFFKYLSITLYRLDLLHIKWSQ